MEPGTSKKKIRLDLSAQAEKYARPDAPLKIRQMAARGALPLEPLDLASLLFALVHDADEDVREAARASLADLPREILAPVLSGPAHPALLSHLARIHREDPEVCEALALNPAASDLTVAFLATLPIRGVVDIVSNNQERLEREPRIVEALGENPLTGRAVIERILDFLGLAPKNVEEGSARAQPSEAEAARAIAAVLGEASLDTARLLASEEDAGQEETTDNLFAAIQKMNVMQKIKLARMGGKEARNLLVKDRNKIVALAALQSPKITEIEVIAMAQSRTISDEILRVIANNRDWTRSYPIKLALSTNPKTPLPQAVKFLNYLQDRDLRSLMKSKEVSTAISTYARRILEKKGRA